MPPALGGSTGTAVAPITTRTGAALPFASATGGSAAASPRSTTGAESAAPESVSPPPASPPALSACAARTSQPASCVESAALSAPSAIPADSAAPHLFVAAAVQAHMARLAASLDADQLVPIRTGVCPVCGGKPAASVVTGVMGAEGARYAACACCQTLWNEVRVKCLSCGSTKGIAFQAVDDGSGDAQVKAETCDECESWVKQMAQNRNPALEAVADDVASLGLDALMQGGKWRRAGFNPFLIGY